MSSIIYPLKATLNASFRTQTAQNLCAEHSSEPREHFSHISAGHEVQTGNNLTLHAITRPRRKVAFIASQSRLQMQVHFYHSRCLCESTNIWEVLAAAIRHEIAVRCVILDI